MLFTETRYDNQGQPPYNVDFFVKDEIVKTHMWKNSADVGRYKKKLIAYDGKTQTVREITYNVPQIGDVLDKTNIDLDEFKNMKVDSSSKAPDGYEFDGGSYGSGAIVTDIFGGGHRGRTARVVKDGAVFKIPNNGNDYYGDNIQFLGWIIQK